MEGEEIRRSGEIYNYIYEDIKENKDNEKELEDIFEKIEILKEEREDIRRNIGKMMRFLDEEYTYNRVFYYMIRKLMISENYGLVRRIARVYKMRETDKERIMREMMREGGEYRKSREKRITDKQKRIIENIELI
jgi:hypothetical protein